ncbi:GNAT family N-acetyltransferase [Spirosoma endophyticum]|uniref:Acetyltransferase (GNAT) domain-containing protein n=1 Tax=Spirosoma endophyticum TaxID=662367 RepID=A0A1I1F3T4_9BACT|nr:GNAT family N-acetyltransferase [Spirosoma endophyticum]SFB93927.1 Acetyltransferase (GNAT) domain-containing protein [Spirosoma endophyticum]
MTFLRITAEHPHLATIQTWYETSFPANERRRFDALRQLLPYSDMHLCALIDEDRLVGFIIYWQWPSVVFVEHFAIDPTLRGNQLGQRALDELLRIDSLYFILEVELPQDDIGRRRIQFYERQGFSLNPFPYAQPPYEVGNPPIPMHLLSIPIMPSQDEFDTISVLIKERIYERFYH